MSYVINGRGNHYSFRDIHGVVDGKIINHGITTRFSNNDKQKIIHTLIDVVSKRANEEVKQYGVNGLSIIMKDTGTQPNWDSTNQMFADDILVETYDLLSQCDDLEVIDTIINHLCEQMGDMIKTQGFCSVGRVGRVYQPYLVLKDYINKSYLPQNNI